MVDNATSVTVDFGDGHISSGLTPNTSVVHTYTNPGDYQPTMQAFNDCGATAIANFALLHVSCSTPAAYDQSVTTTMNTQISITMTGTGTPPLTYIITSSPQYGTLSGGNGATRTYTPNFNVNGVTDSFQFVVVDACANQSAPATVTITIPDVCFTPTAFPQTLSTPENTAKPISLFGNDPEYTASQMTYTIVSQPQNGTLSGSGRNHIYTPATGFIGTDSFQFTATNPCGNTSAPATITINVTAP
jgi:hypothetical protein